MCRDDEVPDRGGVTGEEQARREQVQLEAAELEVGASDREVPGGDVVPPSSESRSMATDFAVALRFFCRREGRGQRFKSASLRRNLSPQAPVVQLASPLRSVGTSLPVRCPDRPLVNI